MIIMTEHIYTEILNNQFKTRKFGFVRGRLLSYNHYTKSYKRPDASAFKNGCFDDFLRLPILTPVLLVHDPDQIVGYIQEFRDHDYQLTFWARIYDIKVFQCARDKFGFSVGAKYNEDDTQETKQGILIKRATIQEVSISIDGFEPEDATAIEF